MKQYLVNILITVACLGAMQSLSAQERENTLEAHVHGVSELMIVSEGDTLEIQFKSPAINIVGFEHKASTSKDIMAVEKSTVTLRQHDALFLISAAVCTHTNTSVDLSKLIDTLHHSHESSSNGSEHTHDQKEHQEHEKQSGRHSEIIASYRYLCKKGTSLPSIIVTLFELFPAIHKINAMWINQSQQGATALTPTNRIINF